MDKSEFAFSIIIAIYNTEKYLTEAIESIINQTFDFNKVQLILVDDGSTDRSKDICMSFKKEYPKNIVYLYQENAGQSIARNNGLAISKGKIVNFLDSDDKLDPNTLQDVYDLFDKTDDLIDVCVIERYNFGVINGPTFLNQKYQNTRIVDIKDEYDFPQLSISASFIQRDALSERFNSKVIISEDSLVLNKTILKKGKFGVVGTSRYLYRKRLEQNSTIDTKKFRKEYFIPRMELYFKELINHSISNYGYVLKYIQSVLMYDLQWFFIDKTHEILSSEELNEFHSLVKFVLQHIDDDIIISQRFLNKSLKYHILNMKYENPNFKVIYNANELLLSYDDKFFDEITNHNLIISDIYKKDNFIYLKGFFDSYFDGIEVNAYNNGNSLNIWKINGDDTYSLGFKVSHRFHFMTLVELSEGMNTISFKISLNSKEYPINVINKTFNNKFLFENNEFSFKYEKYNSNEIIKNNAAQFLSNTTDEKIDSDSFENEVLEINFKPKVSIIVPVFNPGNLLYQCLDSIKNQSLKEIEIICVNDGSSDNSKNILDGYAKNDKRFKVFHQDNQGAGFSRNKAIDNSTGEYIMFVDSDDWIEEDMCKKLYNHAKNLDTDLVVFDSIWHTSKGVSEFNYFSKDEFEEDYETFTFNHDFINSKLMNGSFGVIWSKFYKSSFIKDNYIHFPQHKIYNDVEFHFKTTLLAKNIAYYPEPFYHYIRLGQPSLQTSFREGIDELIWFDVLNGLYEEIINNDQEHLRVNFINYSIYYTFDKLKNIDEKFQSIFIDKIRAFFETLSPTEDELDSLKNIDSMWYTDKTLKFLPMYKNIMSNNAEGLQFDLLKFKISESQENLEKTSNSSKNDEYQKLKENFIKLPLDSKSIENLPLDLSKFYISVLNFEDYDSFNHYNNMLKTDLWDINKMNLTKKIENFNEMGINLEKREKKIIISLTSFPDRIYDIHFCIYSLLVQKFKPDELLLWLAIDQFPNRENDLPEELLKLKNNGLTIKWCHDIKSYKKLIPALKEYPNDYIVTVDDDIYYPKDWLDNIWKQYTKNPNTIISSRPRRIKLNENGLIDQYQKWTFPKKGGETSFFNFPTGAGGTLYFPNALYEEVLNEPVFRKLCPNGDDIWFWAMAILNKTKITVTTPPMNDLIYINLARERGVLDELTLWDSNKEGQNDMQLQNILNKFPQIIDIIKEE